MLTRTAAAIPAILLILGLAAPATASGGPGADPDCGSSVVVVTVCAQDGGRAPGGRGGSGREATTSRGGSSGSAAVKCTYAKLDPQPPADNLAMQEGKRQGGKGAVYQVYCPATARIGVVWVPEGAQAPAQPAIDPETIARKAVDSMKLTEPDIASPRPAGHYVVGMPMSMRVHQGPTTYGPNTVTATAGDVTATATAPRSSRDRRPRFPR